MAHLRSLITRCDFLGCFKRADEAVYTFRNEHHSDFCAGHATRELKRIQADEQRFFEQQRRVTESQ